MSLYTIRKCEKIVKFKGKNRNKPCSSLRFWQIKKTYSFRACVFTLEHVEIEYIRIYGQIQMSFVLGLLKRGDVRDEYKVSGDGYKVVM